MKGECALCPVGGAGDEMGGYKGYSWAMVIELLCIAFQDGDYGPNISGRYFTRPKAHSDYSSPPPPPPHPPTHTHSLN